MTTKISPLRELRRTLRQTFGFTRLRVGQEDVIRSVLEGRHTLAIMPTGAGKSLCYQLPGLSLPGTTVVVSPLISLMKDQVDKLTEMGCTAVQINSTLGSREEAEALERLDRQKHEFVFVTPERLADRDFQARLRRIRLDVFVIDEAHCISEWGHDFRPAYLQLKEAIAALGHPPVLALTATATDQVVEDVIARLGLADVRVVNTGTYRPNLRYEVRHPEDDLRKQELLARLLADEQGTGIVYVATVKHCDELAKALELTGQPVARYHGRLGTRERARTQERFMAGELRCIVATNAFGMGIDKPDIRFVVHYDMPGSLEAYYQESGRAGRDGEPARCVLLYRRADRRTHAFFLAGRYPTADDVLNVYEALQKLKADEEPATLDDIRDLAGRLGKNKALVALALLKERKIVRERRRPAGFSLLKPRLEPGLIRELAADYQARAEHDEAKLERMILYSQTALCRWRILLEYFGEEPEWERCGNCDNCDRPMELPKEPPHAEPAVVDVLPPPAATPAEVVTLTKGTIVSVPQYGTGEIRAVLGDKVEVRFPDATCRKFKREFVEIAIDVVARSRRRRVPKTA